MIKIRMITGASLALDLDPWSSDASAALTDAAVCFPDNNANE